MKALCSLFLAVMLFGQALAQGGQPQPVSAHEEFIVRGRVACINEDRQEIPCGEAPSHFVLNAEDGHQYYFLERDSKRKMFLDSRVRERLLEIKSWKRSAEEIEIIKVYSVRDGQIYNLYYYCPVCSITAFVGGICWCCQDEFEFHEEPLN